MRRVSDSTNSKPPVLVATVLDTEDARGLAEFYRKLFGLSYRAGDEPPAPGEPDPKGQEWLVLVDPNGQHRLGFQRIKQSPVATWPEGPRPQMLHLDTMVPTIEDLFIHRQRALDLGASELRDRSEDPEEPLFVLADPSGHPFCIFVGELTASPTVSQDYP
jgi:catechol 2,3-dioxygenase-like lactoylglutathione lyase family enzyme